MDFQPLKIWTRISAVDAQKRQYLQAFYFQMSTAKQIMKGEICKHLFKWNIAFSVAIF